jgi:exonuclease SbcD
VGKAHAVEIFATLGLPGVTVIGQPGLHLIETAMGRVQVVGLPYITRSFLLSREEYKDQPIEEINRILVAKAEEILRQFATQIDPALPAILTVHGSVANAVLSSEQSIMMVGYDPILPLSALTNPAWDYVALGHIHRHQDLHAGAQPPVVYAGSIERIDFGEEREDKGFVWAQVEKGHTAYAFIPGPARRFVTLRLDTQQGDPLHLLEQALAEHDIKDAIVRVIITVAPEHSDLIDERQIRERLREAYLLAAIVKEEIKAPARSRDSELTEVLGPLQAVERYILSHPEYTERRQALLERAQLLLQELQEELLV